MMATQMTWDEIKKGVSRHMGEWKRAIKGENMI